MRRSLVAGLAAVLALGVVAAVPVPDNAYQPPHAGGLAALDANLSRLSTNRRLLIIGQALHALWRHDQLVSPLDALRALRLDPRFSGRGYGYSSDPAARAMELARSFGLAVEPTYTAKAFAAATSWVTAPRGDKPRSKLRLHERRTYLYWHTLSAVPLDALLAGAPETLPRELARLLFEPSSPNPS